MCHSKEHSVIKPSSGPCLVGMPSSLARQRGATTIVAIIISIVLLGLGIALSNQISSNIRQQSIEYYGARAYLAAQSGMEVAISRLINGNNPACSAITLPVTISAANVQNMQLFAKRKYAVNRYLIRDASELRRVQPSRILTQ